MPKALCLGHVRGLERERVDAVLGRDLAGNFFGGALISERIVVQRIVEIEEHEIDASHIVARFPYYGGVSFKPAIFPCLSTTSSSCSFVPSLNVSRYMAYVRSPCIPERC